MNKLCPICNLPKKHSDTRPNQPSTWSKTCGSRICITSLTQVTNIDVYGHVCNLHSKTENGKTVLENTILEKYNVTNISQLLSVKDKKQETCIDNYGVKWPMQSAIVRAKSLDTVLKKYGVDNVSKNPKVIEKIKETQYERYGDLYMRTEEGKEILKSICQEKYGVDWYFSSIDFKEKLEKRCMELFGVPNPFLSPTVQAEIAKRNGKGKSKEETKWLDSLEVPLEFRQYCIKGNSGSNYIVDGYDPNTNTVYEWNGSFWHGNPEYYKKEDFHPVMKTTTFGELYERTIRKETDLLESGYNLIVKWSTVN